MLSFLNEPMRVSRGVILGVVAALAPATNAHAACVEENMPFGVFCKYVDGAGVTHYTAVPIALGPNGWGTTRYHFTESDGNPCATGKTNCQGASYEYKEVNIDPGWFVTLPTIPNVVFTKDNNEGYWDDYYEGYVKVGAIDYSRNCHGYAFAVNDWVTGGQYGVVSLLEDPFCYQAPPEMKDAKYAINFDGDHSIKVIGAECNDEYTGWDIITSTSEKFRESAIYEQTSGCPDGLNGLIFKAHDGVMANGYQHGISIGSFYFYIMNLGGP